MKCSRNLWLYIVAGMQILRAPIGVSAAYSPCPDVFRYERSPGKEYGIITVPSPYPYIAIDISVGIYITGKLPKTTDIELQLVDKDMIRKVMKGSRDPILYRLDFSEESSPLLTIKNITVNKNVICTAPKPAYADPTDLSTITVHRAFFNKNCQSASLECPGNKIVPRPPIKVPEPSLPFPKMATGENLSGPECGLPAVRRTSLIPEQTTLPGDWPWHAAIYQHTGDDTFYWCAGTFVGTRTIITAAHCFYSARRRMPDEDFSVSLGRYYRSGHEEGAQDIDVSRIFIHPAFNLTSLEADIAIITLSSTVQITAQVRPVCLWSAADTGLQSVVGRYGTLASWGTDERTMSPESFKMVNMQVVSQDTCNFNNPTFFKIFANETTFCARFGPDTNVCVGDSGSGLMFQDGPPDGSGVWRLRGLASTSLGVDHPSHPCDNRRLIRFIDLAPYLSWIEYLLL